MSQIKNVCVVSGKEITKDRVMALELLDVPKEKWTVKEYSAMVAKPTRVSVRDVSGLVLGRDSR